MLGRGAGVGDAGDGVVGVGVGVGVGAVLVSGVAGAVVPSAFPSSVGEGAAGAVVAVVAGAGAVGCLSASAAGSCGPHPAARATIASTPAAVAVAVRLPRDGLLCRCPWTEGALPFRPLLYGPLP